MPAHKWLLALAQGCMQELSRRPRAGVQAHSVGWGNVTAQPKAGLRPTICWNRRRGLIGAHNIWPKVACRRFSVTWRKASAKLGEAQAHTSYARLQSHAAKHAWDTAPPVHVPRQGHPPPSMLVPR